MDQRNLRQALTQSNATLGHFNQQLLLISQQNSFLLERVATLDAWIRQQTAVAHTQSRESATLREALNQADRQRQKLGNNIAEGNALKEKLAQCRRQASEADARISMLRHSKAGLRKLNEENLKLVGELMLKASACATQ